ncbi:739_t:CDS:2 [Paraglomus brasilianum]|uniref:739_t:CDS:1 n=1 Tax=Paraglomus brasilianum TaxID=144538 RepID=A0A9N9CFZ0_9GLOM|nr:739_t:CDS:2 [Paraglomus brasilianum]
MIYYGFYCAPLLQAIYLGMISLFGGATIVVAVASHFRSPEFRWFRTGLFIAMGLSAVFPIAHALIIYGWRLCFDVISLNHMLLMGGMYIAGALIYGARVPERWFPGTFDIWGSSHQIFHIFVVGAALVHYYGVTKTMAYWHAQNHSCQKEIELMATGVKYEKASVHLCMVILNVRINILISHPTNKIQYPVTSFYSSQKHDT